MVSKLMSLFGGLAIAAVTAFGGTNDVSSASVDKTMDAKISSIAIVYSNNTSYAELRGSISSGDLKHYTIQACSNLVGVTWRDSVSGKDIFSEKDKKNDFCVYEPIISAEGFYRIVRKDK